MHKHMHMLMHMHMHMRMYDDSSRASKSERCHQRVRLLRQPTLARKIHLLIRLRECVLRGGSCDVQRFFDARHLIQEAQRRRTALARRRAATCRRLELRRPPRRLRVSGECRR